MFLCQKFEDGTPFSLNEVQTLYTVSIVNPIKKERVNSIIMQLQGSKKLAVGVESGSKVKPHELNFRFSSYGIFFGSTQKAWLSLRFDITPPTNVPAWQADNS